MCQGLRICPLCWGSQWWSRGFFQHHSPLTVWNPFGFHCSQCCCIMNLTGRTTAADLTHGTGSRHSRFVDQVLGPTRHQVPHHPFLHKKTLKSWSDHLWPCFCCNQMMPNAGQPFFLLDSLSLFVCQPWAKLGQKAALRRSEVPGGVLLPYFCLFMFIPYEAFFWPSKYPFFVFTGVYWKLLLCICGSHCPLSQASMRYEVGRVLLRNIMKYIEIPYSLTKKCRHPNINNDNYKTW